MPNALRVMGLGFGTLLWLGSLIVGLLFSLSQVGRKCDRASRDGMNRAAKREEHWYWHDHMLPPVCREECKREARAFPSTPSGDEIVNVSDRQPPLNDR